MNFKAGQLNLASLQPQSLVEVFLSEDNSEGELGTLFAVIEIFSREKKAKKAAAGILESIKDDYYHSGADDIEIALETACQNLNHKIPEIVENPKTWLPKINLLFGALKDEKICLTSRGKIKTFLARGNKFLPIIPEEEKTSKTKNLKFMSSLVVGEILDGDALVFATPSLFDYFAKEKIRKTILNLSPEQAAEYFKNLLAENIGPVSFGALFFKPEEEKMPLEISGIKKLPDFYGTNESMDNLTNLERKTTKIMSASFLATLRNSFHKFRTAPAPKANKNLRVDEMSKPMRASLEKAQRFLAIGTAAPKTLWANLKEKLALPIRKITRYFGGFKNLNKRSKIAGYAILILLVVFLASLPLAKSLGKSKAADKKFGEQKAGVEEALNKAESDLIYKNEAGAAENLKQAQILYANLPHDKKSWQKEIDALVARIQTTSDQIFHVFSVEAQNIINFKNIEVAEISDLTKANGNLFVLAKTPALYQIDPISKAYKPVEISGNNLVGMRFWNKDNLVFVSSENKLVTYSLSQKTFSVKTFQFEAAPTDWYVYADKIYFLVNGDIQKISEPLGEAPTSADWYKDGPELLAGVKKILVDGDVWAVDGQILRFYRGKKTPFSLSRLDRALGQDLEVYTENEWNNIYILDKKNNRLIVAGKTGAVQRQFKNEKLGAAKNLIISDSEDKAWFVNEAEVLEIDLTKR